MLKITSFKSVALITILAFTVSACGFHLRGNIPLPDGIKQMFVQAPKGSFKDVLVDVLENGGGDIKSTRSAAKTVLVIKEARSERTVGTLDERGKVNSYNVIFHVKYVLEDLEGNQLRDAKLTEARRYNFNPEQVIESESEEADLIADMEQDIALRIVRQLSTVTDLDYAPGG